MKESIKICGRTFIIEPDSQVHDGNYNGRYVYICSNVPSYMYFDFDKKTVRYTGINPLYDHTEKSMSDFLSMCDYMKDPTNFFFLKRRNFYGKATVNKRYELLLSRRKIPYGSINDSYKFENHEYFHKALILADDAFCEDEYGYDIEKLVIKIFSCY